MNVLKRCHGVGECQSWHQCLQLGVVDLGLKVRFLILSSLPSSFSLFPVPSQTVFQPPPEAKQQLSQKSLDTENIPLCLSVPEIGCSLCRAGNCCPAAVQGGITHSWLEGRSSLCIWLPSSLIKTLRNSWFCKTLLPEGLWGSRMPRNLLTTSSSQKQQQ